MRKTAQVAGSAWVYHGLRDLTHERHGNPISGDSMAHHDETHAASHSCSPADSVAELDRREFLRLSLMTSALLATGAATQAEAESSLPAPPKFAALTPLVPGAVRPEGWLRLYLEKQGCAARRAIAADLLAFHRCLLVW